MPPKLPERQGRIRVAADNPRGRGTKSRIALFGRGPEALVTHIGEGAPTKLRTTATLSTGLAWESRGGGRGKTRTSEAFGTSRYKCLTTASRACDATQTTDRWSPAEPRQE